MQAESKVNILLVDDKPENLLALKVILADLEENLVQATSGEEALRYLLYQDFAVILLDVQMPGMDGFEAASLIRSRQKSRQTPIIFLTAFSTDDNMQFKGYAAGAVDYLLKPIDQHILTSKVKIFVELYKKSEVLKLQAQQLAILNSELKQSEERFRSLSTSSPVGIFEIDSQGNCTYTNPRYQAICHVTAAESLDKSWLEFVKADDKDAATTSWSNYLNQGKEYTQEFRFLFPEDIVRWLRVRCTPMLATDGSIQGHVGTIEDITDQKNAEETRAQMFREQAARQEAEAANQMKDEFLAILSHELRTPLTAMLGWSKILRTKKLDEQGTSRALDAIERNAIAQTQLIEDILDVSRIIRGQLRLNLGVVDLQMIITAALDAVRPQAEMKNLQLDICLDTNVGKVSGDAVRLQQVISNLLTNAIKFTPKNGKVEVTLKRAETSWVEIAVRDTGIGIEPEFLPKVFERFRQADSSTTRSQNGLGLGLAIVHHLVELHKGSISAFSLGTGQGATFTVKLPVLQNKHNHLNSGNTSSSSSASLPLAGLRILIVDDEVDNRNFLSFFIQQQGANVTAVTSADEAFAVFQEIQPDVLISDICMPGEDGYTLIKKIRTLPVETGQKIPAIALTACSHEEDCAQALNAGFHEYISKPFEPSDLITRITKITGLS
ncbi:PAS/PAC sensor hybrid histidine kinase [Calothrix sp. NIES-4101]|nr:PAS/PAC sensor hybrid histidine kinase [Calothrix sp. NIES-4101]